jgi:hypothetical protein
VYDSEAEDFLQCGECGWRGHRCQTADDGPAYAVCCPLCGHDLSERTEAERVQDSSANSDDQ